MLLTALATIAVTPTTLSVGEKETATGEAGVAVVTIVKIEFKTRAVAIDVGYERGKKILKMHDGSVHTFKVKGVSLVDIGVSEIEATCKVYHFLAAPEGIEGKYLAGAAGITIYRGGSAVAMQNGNGVVIHLKSKQKGIKFTLAPQVCISRT